MDVKLKVRVGKTLLGREILTDIGIAQGLSALLFIFYLALAIRNLPEERQRTDCEKICWSELDWIIERDVHKTQ